MKAFLTFFILYFFSLSVSAQQFKRIFLFNDFVQAQIKFRNHSVSVVSLNYDASSKTMLFRTYIHIFKQCFFDRERK